MRTIISNDVTKLLVFLIAAFILAALLVPQVYNLGQLVAEITATKNVTPLIDYLGTQTRKADYSRYFNYSLYLAALILFPFLLLSLRARKAIATRQGPWSFALPARCIASNRGQALLSPPHPYRQILGGFAMGMVFLAAVGAAALLLNLYTWAGHSFLAAIPGALTTAVVVALLEETIFRGIVLGIFLRTFRPSLAILFTALLFAALHFIPSSESLLVAHPEGLLSGFTFLELAVQRSLSPPLLLQQFAPLLLVGILLGTTRYLTSSLWLPIGLHTGWAFSFILFDELTKAAATRPEWTWLMLGDNLAQGLFPLTALAINALIIWLVYRKPDYYEAPSVTNLPSSATT